MQTPHFVAEVLNDYDACPRPVAEYQIASAMFAALQHHKPLSQEDEEGFRAEVWAFELPASEPGEASAWETHFGPRRAEGAQNASNGLFPDIKHRGAELVEYWKSRAEETRHPVLRARYADLVWDLARVAASARPDIRFARLAVDSYLEAVDARLYQEETHGIRCAIRALNLSLGANDKQLIARARDAMFHLFDLVAVPHLPGTWVFLFDSLYANRKVELTDEQEAKLIGSLENILAKCATNGQNLNVFAAEHAAQRLERHYTRIERPQEVDRVTRAFGNVIEKLGEGGRAAEALVCLQALIKRYQERGMAEDAGRANQLLSGLMEKLRGELWEVSATVPIPADKLEEYLSALTSGGLAEAIGKIASRFTPRIKEVRKSLQDAENNFPFSSMLGTHIVRDTGIVAQAGSISADPESRLLMQLTEFMDLATPFLAWTIDRTRELYSPSSDDIVDALYHSPAFDPDRRDLIRNGIEAYLSDDFVKGVHVLLPQIEHTLLRLAENLGVVTRKPSRHNPNAMQWINLYEVLQDALVQECLGEDLTRYLQVLLVDPLGHNIRNHVCNGHLKPEDFTRQLADRVFHVLLALSLIREPRDAKED